MTLLFKSDSIFTETTGPKTSVYLDIFSRRCREYLILEFPHKFRRLLRQAKGQYGVGQYSCQMGYKALVDG